MDLTLFFTDVAAGNTDNVAGQLNKHHFLTHVRNPDAELWDESTALHSAAKHGHLDVVKLLVAAGSEVYSNPMATYPPVIVAAWNKQQGVVDYFM